MKIIKQKGFDILVDDDVYEWASKRRWTIDKSGYTYYARCGEGRIHRIILGLENPSVVVDHINRNGLDNRRENLRICTVAENNRNCQKRIGNTTSQYKGVYWNKRRKKWEAHIKHNGKVYYCGLFENELDAAIAYNEAAMDKFGSFAALNKI